MKVGDNKITITSIDIKNKDLNKFFYALAIKYLRNVDIYLYFTKKAKELFANRVHELSQETIRLLISTTHPNMFTILLKYLSVENKIYALDFPKLREYMLTYNEVELLVSEIIKRIERKKPEELETDDTWDNFSYYIASQKSIKRFEKYLHLKPVAKGVILHDRCSARLMFEILQKFPSLKSSVVETRKFKKFIVMNKFQIIKGPHYDETESLEEKID